MDMSKYQKLYLTEAREHLQRMSRHLLALERNGSDVEGIHALFREAHSIKGMAASMGYERTAELSHAMEDVLQRFRSAGAIPAEEVDRLLRAVDMLEKLTQDVEAQRPEREFSFPQLTAPQTPSLPGENSVDSPPPPSPSLAPGAAAASRLQVTVKLVPGSAAPAARALLLLKEMGRFGKILSCDPAEEDLCRGAAVSSLRVRLRSDSSPEAVKTHLARMADVDGVYITGANHRPKEGAAPNRREESSRSVRVSTELLDRFVDLTGELITSRYMLQNALGCSDLEELRRQVDQQSRLIADLHHHVMQVRMMPLESITAPLPRLVRDLGRRTGKEIAFQVEGVEVELDRAILEGLSDSLVHLVRNAVDHGIEKSGTVSVRARRDKDQVVLEVADDGRGMDIEAIRRTAVKKGLLAPEQARALSTRQVLDLVCLPGFSTASRITETSGRGVGMDVVKSAAEGMGGSLEIDSEPGSGTCFRLRLPTTAAIIHVLLVKCAGHLLGIPFSRVQRAMEIEPAQIRSEQGRSYFTLAGEEVPLVSLRRVLDLPGPRPPGLVPVVVTERRGRLFGLVPDALAGQRQAFVKGLSFPLDRLQGVTGATVLGDGSIVFIIDPRSLLEKSHVRSDRTEGEQPCRSSA